MRNTQYERTEENASNLLQRISNLGDKVDPVRRLITSELDSFEIDFWDSDIIDKGMGSLIYVLSKKNVIKVRRYSEYQHELKNEYDIQKKLFDEGYPVPRPYGVFPVKIPCGQDFKEDLGLFMEFVNGENLEDVHFNKESLIRRAKNMVNKIKKETGIKISNTYSLYPRNIIYNRPKNELILIDFEHWRLPKQNGKT